MKKSILIALLFVGFIGLCNAQNKIKQYEYWFDDNLAGKTTVNAVENTEIQINTSVSTAALPSGLHSIHFRFKDTKGLWSATVNQFFIKIPSNTNQHHQISRYEYWFDNNYSQKITQSVTAQDSIAISISLLTNTLPAGLHSIHIRFCDNTGLWSSAINQFFIKIPSNTNQNQINKYEYWFDNNYSQKITQSVTAQDSIAISTSLLTNTLPAGLHSIHIRFCDNTGLWSSAINQFFIKIPSNSNQHHQICRYEYWFDNNYSQAVSQSVNPQDSITMLTSVNTNTLPKGLHTFHLRYQDNTGLWSSAINQFFIKPVFADTSNKIIAYRYWFDTLYTNQVTINVNPANPLQLNNVIIPVTAVQKVTPNDYVFNPDPVNGVNITYLTPTLLHMQFKDTKGLWSSSLVDTVKYRYTLPVICDTLLSNVTKTKNNPIKDTLHFFTFNALQGDSLIFKTNKALIIDIFDTYGLKIKTITASESINGKGIRANLDGPYFALVHGFSAPSGTYTITYTHVAKYAVLDYTPHKVGNNGNTFIVFHGNGFNNSTSITLIKDTITVISDSILNKNLGVLGAYFNFANADTGKYDIIVNFGDTIIIINDGVEVEAIGTFDISVNIAGPSVIRVGSTGSYTIFYSNNSNVTAKVVPIWIGLNSDAIVNFKFPVAVPMDTNITDMYPYFETNRIAGVDGTFKVYCFYIPIISPYEQGQLILGIKPTSNLQLFSWIGKPLINSNSINNNFIINPTMLNSTCDIPDYCSDLSKTQIATNLQTCGCGIGMGLIDALSNMMLGLQFRDRQDQNYQDELRIAWENGFVTDEQYKKLSWTPPLKNPYHIWEESLNKCMSSNAAKAVVGALKTINGDQFKNWPDCLKPPTRHNSRLVNSWDPNDKIGFRSPSGSLSFNAAKNNFTYIINFENKDSATAPAQEVWIIDTINKNLLDINSFKAGYIKIGNRIVHAPYNAQNHTWEVDMRPAMNLRTRVQLTLDTLNGIARWYFKSIDPLTSNLPIDPFSGFLPPNDSTGSGQGSVAFTINLKDSLSDGTNIYNRATILFDNNPPIPTPTWTNTMDNTKPLSFIEPLAPHQTSDTINLYWHGSDSGSGIYNYAIYVSENGNNSYLWKTTHDTSAIFIGGVDTTYRFYSIATDSAGNIENTPLNFDAITTICHIPVKATLAVGLDTVCANTNIVYTSNSDFANKYNWNIYPSAAGFTNDTTSSANIHWDKRYSGLAHIYVKGTNECGIGDYSDTLTITVNPLPDSAQQITGLATVCQGQNNVAYKVPAITNATSYLWSLPNGATGNSTADSIQLNFSNTAVSGQISVKGVNACGNGDSSTLAVTVNPLPATAGTITGLASVCQGQSSVVYKVPSIANATSYTWTLPSGATGTSSVDSIVVSYGTSAVSGNITVKGGNSCGTGDSSTLAITVNPLPGIAGQIIGTNTVCQGSSNLIFHVSSMPNANSYIWSYSGTGASIIGSDTVVAVSFSNIAISGSISVVGQNTCGNGGYTQALNINVLQKPSTPVITQSGNELYSSVMWGNQWYDLLSGILNNDTNVVYLPSQIGDYFVIVTQNGCNSDSSNIIHYDNTGIGNELATVLDVKVIPNPVSDKAQLIYALKDCSEVKITLFDITGRVLETLYNGTNERGEHRLMIDSRHLSAGVCFYQIEIGKDSFTGKLIVTK